MRPAAFSPAAFGIAPQKITLRAYVQDRFPDRGRVYSEPVILYVLTRDEHAQMLKSQFDRQITELEDLARREQDLLDENQRLEKLDGAELQKEENRKRLEKQQQEEAETKNRTENLTERMEQLMKDATRNGDIDKKTLQKIAESLKSLQELSKEDVPKVEQKLGDSQEQSNTPEKSKKDVQEAVEEQKKAVEKMKESAEKANDANKRFEAGTFINRLKKAAGEQSGIVASLKEAFDRMLGLKTPALDPTDLRRLNDNNRQQSDTAADVRWIEEDLAHYYSRTKEESFKAIMDEMRESRIGIGLETVRQRLSSNHSFEAAEEAKKWADKLNEWAKKLEGEKDKNGGDGGGGGGGDGAPDAEDEDFEFMLRVMKMIQQEQDLRARTRALEQLRRGSETPTPQAPGSRQP
jgi:DNA repair exonuclease SbcCD ATPase subunit